MHHSSLRARRIAALVVAAVIAAVLALITVVAVQASFAAFALPALSATDTADATDATDATAPVTPAAPADSRTELSTQREQPFLPTSADGHIAEGIMVTRNDTDIPAIARLDPALLDALRQAETDAAAHGIRHLQISSGWRSVEYQRWLLDDAIARYGSEEVARQYVATPDTSRHVTGDAVDIAMADAQRWLDEHGARYGLCQTYANEPWHFELATEPGGTCPAMKTDAAG